MNIGKNNKTYTVTAMLVSTAFLFAGCGADQTEKLQIEPITVEEERTDHKGVAGETDPDQEALASEPDRMKEETQDDDTTDENAMSDKQEASSDGTDIYDDVLAQYSDMVQNDFYTSLLDSDTYESSFGKDIGQEIRTHQQEVYYAYYDIDGNGTMELIIAGGEHGVSNPAFVPWNYDLYGYDGDNVVSIFPEMEFGYRTNFSLYENGVIEVFYSGSAAELGLDFYRIGSDGVTPERMDSFSSVANLEGEEAVFTYYEGKNEITEEEYRAGIQNYAVPLTAALDWRQIQ